MSQTRYPPDLGLTAEDFANCGWQEALRTADPWDYHLIWHALDRAASGAENNDRRAKALGLLAGACSMKFSPERAAEPFTPLFFSSDRPLFSPDDLLESDVSFLATAATAMETSTSGALLLRARLADLVWLVQQPRDVKFARLAIDSYAAVPLNEETWPRDGLDCWQRALRLARLRGVASTKRHEELEATVLAAFDAASQEHGVLSVKLAKLMRSNGLGHGRAVDVAEKLGSLGRAFSNEDEFLRARAYFKEAAAWCKSSNDLVRAAAMTVAEAECWVKDAERRLSSADPSHGVASEFIQGAIQTYRAIPHSQRETHDVAERIARLQARLREYGAQAVDELTKTKGPGVDISDWVRQAREVVTGKSMIEALRAFVNLTEWRNADDSRAMAIDSLRNYPISSLLFPTVTRSHDGRVIGKNPPAHLGDTLTKSDEPAISDRVLREYGIRASLVTQGSILPALDVLRLEHRIRELDFIELASQAAIVPPGRALLFGKSLFAGYDGDFAAAVHLLVPQIENLVRVRLSLAGVETRHLDRDGIQTEKGLNSLLALSESSQVFGPNVAFELECLFSGPGGANLRNDVAHGLLDDVQAAHGVYPIYAWWLALKLVFSSFWNSVALNAEETSRADDG